MKLIHIVSFVLSFVLISCTTVVTETPIGLKPTQINSKDWNGTWIGSGETLIVNVVDEKLGKIKLGMIIKEDGFVKLKNLDAFLTETNNIKYVNLHLSQFTDKVEIKEKYPDHYVWARYKKGKDSLLIWPTNDDEIRQLIKDQQLQGTVDPYYIKLNDVSDNKITFDLENPGVLIRVVKKR